MTSRRAARLVLDAALAYLLFWGSHTVYRASTGIVQLCDSAYSLVVAQKWLAEGTLDLSGCLPADPALRRALPGYIPESDMPYHFVRVGDPSDDAPVMRGALPGSVFGELVSLGAQFAGVVGLPLGGLLPLFLE